MITAANTLFQVRFSVIVHPVLDTGTRMKAPSFGNVAAYVWIPCQARDDNL